MDFGKTLTTNNVNIILKIKEEKQIIIIIIIILRVKCTKRVEKRKRIWNVFRVFFLV